MEENDDRMQKLNKSFLKATLCGTYYTRQANSRKLSWLLLKGADVNVTDGCGYTALMRVARAGCAQNMKLLLKSGADVNIVNFNGSTALSIATWNYNRECINLLIKAGAEVGSPKVWHRMMIAAVDMKNSSLG